MSTVIHDVLAELAAGQVIPYLGPGVLAATAGAEALPAAPELLVRQLIVKASVPHKIRNNLTAAAQFIENFKHRKTVVTLMSEAFTNEAAPGALHYYFASMPQLPLIVSTWYDNLLQKALADHASWCQIQGVSQSEHFGKWVHYFNAQGKPVDEAHAAKAATLLYQPLGSITPARNFLVSDSDYVEVLTEIDIQTPIPPEVQARRQGRHFLFLGCRFNTQLERTFARQIMKRSSDKHWALLPGELTRNELRFLEEQNITRIDMTLQEFIALAVENDIKRCVA